VKILKKKLKSQADALEQLRQQQLSEQLQKYQNQNNHMRRAQLLEKSRLNHKIAKKAHAITIVGKQEGVLCHQP